MKIVYVCTYRGMFDCVSLSLVLIDLQVKYVYWLADNRKHYISAHTKILTDNNMSILSYYPFLCLLGCTRISIHVLYE